MEWSKKLPLASGSELLDSLAVMASGLARATICVGKAILLMVIGAAAAVALVARAPPGRAEAPKLSPKKRLLRKKQAQMRSRRGGD